MDVSTCPTRAAGQGVLFLGSCLAGLFRDCRSKQGACCHWIEIQRIVRFKSSHDLDRSTCCWGVSLRLLLLLFHGLIVPPRGLHAPRAWLARTSCSATPGARA